MKLTKSQRITYIKDIAEFQEDDDWTSIDLVLQQFSLPTSNEWNGDKKSYVVAMIEDSSDNELLELAKHFGMAQKTEDNDPSPVDPPYWEEGKLKVFISHLSTHREQASSIKTSLVQFGISSFVAHNDVHPTAEWQVEIESALATCDLLVAIIHPNFVESQWCDQEIGYALGRGIPVFTIRCGADPYGFVSRFQAFNGNGKSNFQIAREIFEAAIVHKKLQLKMAAILVDLFVKSGSFAVAKTRINYLEQLKIWDQNFSDKIKKAIKDNNQVRGSWGVPEQVENLIKKWAKP